MRFHGLTLALLLLASAPTGLANCYNWKAGANSTCPATCKLSKSPSGPVSIDLKGCAACTDGERNLPLTCFRCKPGFAHLYYAVDLHECLPISQLQCHTTRLNPTLEDDALLSGPCRQCIQGAIRVWATARAEDYFKRGTSTGGVQAASSAVAPIPVEKPPRYPFPEMEQNDYEPLKDARTWTAHAACRTCSQLGCDRRCTNAKGCQSCPAGSVLLQTVMPGTSDTFKGEYLAGWLYGYEQRKAPPLPALCMQVAEDLGCAASKAKNNVGCTACPGGKTLQRIRPQMLAGSNFLQLQPEGKACY